MQTIDVYRLSEKTGAVLEEPLLKLPSSHEPWNLIIQQLPNWFSKNEVRKEIMKMPVLSTYGLCSHEELRFAHKTLTFAGCAYIWQNGPGNEPESLPPQLAVPLIESSRKLGLAPTFTHPDLVLGNCRYTGAGKLPECIHTPTNHDSWKPFVEASGLIEILFAPAPKLMLKAIRSQDPLDCDKITDCLLQLCDVLHKMTRGLDAFYGYLRPEGFYMDLRPLLTSWSNCTKDQVLMYEGVSSVSNGHRCCKASDRESNWLQMKCPGASAAQSICLQALDAFLQVAHDAEDQRFFLSNRECMIAEQRRFLEDLATYSKIGQIGRTTNDVELRESYESLTAAMRKFRLCHLSLVNTFIFKPSVEFTVGMKSLETTGTGGQSLSSFLQRVRNNTR